MRDEERSWTPGCRRLTVVQETRSTDFDDIGTQFDRAGAADHLERPAGQKNHRHRVRTRTSPARHASREQAQTVIEFFPATVERRPLPETADAIHRLGKILVADDRHPRGVFPGPHDQHQRLAPPHLRLLGQLPLAKHAPNRLGIDCNLSVRNLTVNDRRPVDARELQVLDLHEPESPAPVHQSLQLPGVRNEHVFEEVAANRLPPLVRVHQGAEGGPVEPDRGLVENPGQSFPVEQLRQVAVMDAGNRPSTRQPRLHVRPVPVEVRAQRQLRRIHGKSAAKLEPHLFPKPDAGRTLALPPPLVRQVDGERHIDGGCTGRIITPGRPDFDNPGMFGNEDQGAPNGAPESGTGHCSPYPWACGCRPIGPDPRTTGAPISAVIRRNP